MRSTPYHRMTQVIAVTGCTRLCNLFVPESSAGIYLSVLSAVPQGSKKNKFFKNTYKNLKIIKPESEDEAGKKGKNRETRLWCWGEETGNENLRSRKRRFGPVSKWGSWDFHKNKNMVILTLVKKSQRRERMQLWGPAGRSLESNTNTLPRSVRKRSLDSGKYGQLGWGDESEERRENKGREEDGKAVWRTGRKSLCLINSRPKPTVRKFLHLSISKKAIAKSKGKVHCMHV